MKKINAFTLLEMVLAMMLASVVIGMAYTGFTLFSRIYDGYRSKNLKHAGIRMFKAVLDRDMERGGAVVIKDRQVSFGLLSYELMEDELVRSAGLERDTFRMEHLQMQAFFEGDPVQTGRIDHLVFRFEQEGRQLVISGIRLYSSAELFDLAEPFYNSAEPLNDEEGLWNP